MRDTVEAKLEKFEDRLNGIFLEWANIAFKTTFQLHALFLSGWVALVATKNPLPSGLSVLAYVAVGSHVVSLLLLFWVGVLSYLTGRTGVLTLAAKGWQGLADQAYQASVKKIGNLLMVLTVTVAALTTLSLILSPIVLFVYISQ